MPLGGNYIGLTGYGDLYFGEKKDGIHHSQGEITDIDKNMFLGEYKFRKLDGQKEEVFLLMGIGL